jgi:pimeloyl-ACP methyl ester carboxylesterase
MIETSVIFLKGNSMKRFVPLTLLTLALGFSACQNTNTPSPEATAPNPVVPDAELMEVQANGKALPNFTATANCPFQLPPNIKPEQTKCGYVEVRENRREPTDRTIKLAVLVVKNLLGKANTTANIVLNGGPGGSAQGDIFALGDPSYLNTYAGEFDLIYFDQRGSGQSQPRLECPSEQSAAARLQSLAARTLSDAEDYEKEVAQNVAAGLRCRDALVAKGYNLNAYNTFESAGDINDIRKVLGYKQLNIDGKSYGSYLAQIALRDYPSVIRSVNLEAIINPRQDWLSESPLSFDRSRIEVFRACATTPACNKAFPNLNQAFESIYRQLEVTKPTIDVPVSETETVPVQVDGDFYLFVLTQYLYDPSFIPYVPLYVYVAKSGDYGFFASLLSGFIGSDAGNSAGMYNSVVCSDVVQFTPEQVVRSNMSRTTPLYQQQLGLSALVANKICQKWGVRPDVAARNPVFSDKPALLQTGYFDPITPPNYTTSVSFQLRNNTVAFYPAGSHGATRLSYAPGDEGSCAQGILTSFFKTPSVKPNTACAGRPAWFIVPAQGARAQSKDFPLPQFTPNPLFRY